MLPVLFRRESGLSAEGFPEVTWRLETAALADLCDCFHAVLKRPFGPLNPVT